MNYNTQTFLTTNAEIFIPSAATIQGSAVQTFQRNGKNLELPGLVYSFLPSRPDAPANGSYPQQRVVASRSWDVRQSDPMGTNLVKVRVFIIPLTDTTSICTYALPTSDNHHIQQYSDVELQGSRYYFFVEMPPGFHQNTTSVATPTPSTVSNTPGRQTSLGPAVRDNNQHRVIN